MSETILPTPEVTGAPAPRTRVLMITKEQADLLGPAWREAEAATHRFQTIARVILAGHGLTQAQLIGLEAQDGKPMLQVSVPAQPDGGV